MEQSSSIKINGEAGRDFLLQAEAGYDENIALYSYVHGKFLRVDGFSALRVRIVQGGEISDDNIVGYRASFDKVHNLHSLLSVQIGAKLLDTFDIALFPSPDPIIVPIGHELIGKSISLHVSKRGFVTMTGEGENVREMSYLRGVTAL